MNHKIHARHENKIIFSELPESYRYEAWSVSQLRGLSQSKSQKICPMKHEELTTKITKRARDKKYFFFRVFRAFRG